MLASVLTLAGTVLRLPRSEIADQIVWIVVATIVAFATSAATTARRSIEDRLMVDAAAERIRRRDAEPISAIGMAAG
jgi:hypothetical protein